MICRIFGHAMRFDSSDISGPSTCKRCPHHEPAIVWSRSAVLETGTECVPPRPSLEVPKPPPSADIISSEPPPSLVGAFVLVALIVIISIAFMQNWP